MNGDSPAKTSGQTGSGARGNGQLHAAKSYRSSVKTPYSAIEALWIGTANRTKIPRAREVKRTPLRTERSRKSGAELASPAGCAVVIAGPPLHKTLTHRRCSPDMPVPFDRAWLSRTPDQDDARR